MHRFKDRLKTFCVLTVILVSGGLFAPKPVLAADLMVYVPSISRAHAIRKEIGAVCPDVKPYVFSNGSDFRRQMKHRSVSAVLTLPMIIGKYEGYDIKIRGEINGDSSEPYLLVSSKKQLDINDLDKRYVGIYDFLGRKAIRAYVKSELEADVYVKTVRKVIDLLSFLLLEEVEGIIVSESFLERFKKRSRLTFYVTETPISVDLPSVAIKNQRDTKIIEDCVKRFDDTINAMLGVESWR